MGKIYFAGTNGKLYDNYDISKAAFIISGEHIDMDNFSEIRDFANKCDGIKKEISRPSVRYLVRKGDVVKATQLYYDTHPEISLLESRDIVNRMKEEIDNK